MNNEWISVKYSLPEHSITVLIYMDETMTDRMSTGYTHINSPTVFLLDNAGVSMPEVTHWMSLPNPPRKKDNVLQRFKTYVGGVFKRFG